MTEKKKRDAMADRGRRDDEHPELGRLGEADPDSFDALVEQEEAKLAENDPPEPEEPAEPFEVTLYFDFGLVHSIQVTHWLPVPPLAGTKIQHVDWKQEHSEPGDPLLSWVDWSRVVMIEARSFTTRHRAQPRRGRRG